MLNVLINAYAVSPTWGSEPGVGWNWIINLAKYCNVFVITESEWEEDINKALLSLPQRDNIHFFFNPVSQQVRDMCWHQGDWRFYKYYNDWQKKTLAIAKDIISKYRIDVIHQLNMIGFREPGYLWQIKEIPFVWGPIGNMAPLPLGLLNGSPLSDKVKQGLKNLISYYQARFGRVAKALKRADKLITVLDSTAEIIREHYGISEIEVMPETGLKITDHINHDIPNDRPLRLLWVGRFIPTKKLDLALEIVASVKNSIDIELHIVGWGSEKEEKYYRDLAKKLDITSYCKWYGRIPNPEVQKFMQQCDIFFFTSVVEGTPHVVLEAISNNLPVLCFDMCGQGVIVNDQVGWKVKVKNISEAKKMMSEIILNLNGNRGEILSKSENCEIRKPQLSWARKIESVIGIYKSVIK